MSVIRCRILFVISLAATVGARAQPAAPDAPPQPIFASEERGAAFERLLAALLAAPDPAALRSHHDLLASEPHIAGTPGGERGAERLASLFRSFGLDVRTPRYSVLLADHVSSSVTIIAPETIDLPLREPVVAEDLFSAHPGLAPGFHAFSGSGEGSGRVVYANYGTKDDFARLAALNVDVKGAVVIARQGGNFRGFKARFAQDAGAVALIMYPDPRDNGFAVGLPYPEGGYFNEHSIHRGSLPTLPYSGDALTPGVAATMDLPDERRLTPSDVDLPKIPVQPIGWGSAREILSRMTGPPTPPEWQGALPFTYRLTGGDGLRVRVRVDQPRVRKTITDVIATIPGAVRPDQMVIVGAHHDAWNFGADDPLSGTIVVAEAARAFAAAAKAGLRPARTIVFAGWDAEEWGIIGSVEWVEEHAAELISGCLAYINLDAAVSGSRFDASASPSMRAIIDFAAALTPQPASLPRPWERFMPRAPQTPTSVLLTSRAARAESDLPRTLGGGSDHDGFLSHLAIPCAAPGFGGGAGTQWHTNGDTLFWYRRMMGDDYSPHVALTRVVTLALAVLADADLPPTDPAAWAREAIALLEPIARRARSLGVEFDPAPFRGQFERLKTEADLTASVLADARGASPEALSAAAAALRDADRAWFHEPGLPGRPWRRNLFVGPDEDSGYAPWPLPALRVGVERKDPAMIADALRLYTDVSTRAAAALRRAREALSPSP